LSYKIRVFVASGFYSVMLKTTAAWNWTTCIRVLCM